MSSWETWVLIATSLCHPHLISGFSPTWVPSLPGLPKEPGPQQRLFDEFL